MPYNMATPSVGAYSQISGPEQEDQVFKQRFTEMAYAALAARFPELMPYVVTFKILESAIEESNGIGVFVLSYNEKPVYIPCILHSGKLKPLEILYHKELNTFLPLSVTWLDEIAKMDIDAMGNPSELPPDVSQDVNIRNLVIPPQSFTGRVGYASAEDVLLHNIKDMLKEAEVQEYNVKPVQFLNALARAPKVALDGIKLAFTRQPKLLQILTRNYGTDNLTQAMKLGYENYSAFSKVAALREYKGELKILTKTASSKEIKSVFGSSAGTAFGNICKHGYAIKDTRITKNAAVKMEKPTFLEEPGAVGGWFRLYFLDNKPDIYLVIPFAKTGGSRGEVYYYDMGTAKVDMDYLVIRKDGARAWTTNKLIGERCYGNEKEVENSRLAKILEDGEGDKPTIGSVGMFINITGKGIDATHPEIVERIAEGDSSKSVYTKYGPTYVVDTKSSRTRIDRTSDFIFVPKTAKYINMGKSKEELIKGKKSIIDDPKLLVKWMNNIMQDSGAENPKVKTAGLNQWWVLNSSTPLSLKDALYKVAMYYDVPALDAYNILNDAKSFGTSTTYIMPKNALPQVKVAFNKYAQTMTEEPMASQYGAGGFPEMQPNPGAEYSMGPVGTNQLDPMQPQGGQQQPPPPEPISPTDLALGEAVQQLQQEQQMQMQQTQAQMDQLQQQLDMQQQSSQQLIQTLQGIQQRSAELSQASNGQIPSNAMQSPAVAAQAIAPVNQEPPPPPTPYMDSENTTPDTIAQQINPEMLDQAEAFQDAGMFDTAAVGMLANAPVFQDIVSTYVPNLEKAVDNMGRILLSLWIKEDEIKEAIGDESFITTEDKLRSLFKNMGETVLTLSHSATDNPDISRMQGSNQMNG